MQKGDKNKLKLMLAGVKARAEQNHEYFISIDFLFRSGKKKFKASLARSGEAYTLTFQGTARSIGLAEALEFFAAQAEQYEESVLAYTERRIPCWTVGGSISSRSAAPRRCCGKSGS